RLAAAARARHDREIAHLEGSRRALLGADAARRVARRLSLSRARPGTKAPCRLPGSAARRRGRSHGGLRTGRASARPRARGEETTPPNCTNHGDGHHGGGQESDEAARTKWRAEVGSPSTRVRDPARVDGESGEDRAELDQDSNGRPLTLGRGNGQAEADGRPGTP